MYYLSESVRWPHVLQAHITEAVNMAQDRPLRRLLGGHDGALALHTHVVQARNDDDDEPYFYHFSATFFD